MPSEMVNPDNSVDALHEFIKGCAENDRLSQSRLYAVLAPRLFPVCLRYSKSREEAEEILQEGFMQVFKMIHQFRGEGAFEAWVRRIMVNCALQRLRSKSTLSAVLNLTEEAEALPEKEYILSQLDAKELIGLIQQLSPMYRAVFNLYVFEGYKHREIAELLGISEGTSKSNLSDARTILQKAVLRRMPAVQLKQLSHE